MNIFVLDEFPMLAAQYHSDTHVVKMTLESAQLLCTCHHALAPIREHPLKHLYRPTHITHPCAKWLRESRTNYEWLYELFRHLADEYKFRYHKDHKSWVDLKRLLAKPPERIPDKSRTPFARAFGVNWVEDLMLAGDVDAYRRYYVTKHDINRWERGRPQPEWYTDLLGQSLSRPRELGKQENYNG